MEHKIILKCRVCLDEYVDTEMFDLFPQQSVGPTAGRGACCSLRLAEKVQLCCGVRIRASPEMPAQICFKCFDLTRMWYNFRQMCLHSQVYLESLCTDRCKPAAVAALDDSHYLEYLIEELQSVDVDARAASSRYMLFDAIKEEQDDAFSGDESAGDSIEIVSATSDQETQPTRTMQHFKKEDDHADNDEEDIDLDNGEQRDHSMEQQYEDRQKLHSNTKSSGYIARKYFHGASPASYMCSICGNMYTKKATFTYHMTQHSNTKPHECEICAKTFRLVAELKIHMRRHTGEKPYKCVHCDRHFIDHSEKRRHERVHTNTRPYACNVCGKRFGYSAILKNHAKLHSGEKDFVCKVCEKAFTLRHQYKKHLQTLTHKQKEAQIEATYE